MSDGWKGRPESSNRFTLKLMLRLTLFLGRRGIRPVLVPVALYFLLVRGPERRASRKFLSAAMGRPVSLGDIYKHFYTFAEVTVDRIFFLSGRTEGIPVAEHDAYLLAELAAKGTGGVFLAAHMGSFEAARSIAADQSGFEVRMVLDRAVNQNFIDTLESFSPGFAASLIDSNQQESSLGLVIAEAVQAGAWVGFLADRYMPGDRTAECQFMGATVRLPIGPFVVAAVTRVPVVCVFPLYINGVYEVHCEVLSEAVNLPRGERDARLQELAQRYATRLEHYARLAPYSWFNFFDFWETRA